MDWYLILVLPYYGDKKMITQKTEPSKKSLYAPVTGVFRQKHFCGQERHFIVHLIIILKGFRQKVPEGF